MEHLELDFDRVFACSWKSTSLMKIKGLYRMPESKYLWYRWSESGKRHAVSLKTDDLPEAIKKIKENQAGRLSARWERAEPLKTASTKAVEKYLVLAQKRD